MCDNKLTRLMIMAQVMNKPGKTIEEACTNKRINDTFTWGGGWVENLQKKCPVRCRPYLPNSFGYCKYFDPYNSSF